MKLKSHEIETLVTRIESRRLALGYNYSEISRLSGVNQGQVSRICRGHFKTASGNVMQICMILGIEIQSGEQHDFVRLKEAILGVWDGTSADADRISRLLSVVGEVRRG